MEKLVIGIDFSKETMNYCCVQGSAETILKEGVVDNTPEGCKEMIRELRTLHHGLRVSDFLFCGENTGCYSIAVSEYLFSKKYVVWIESPLQIKLHSGIRRVKTDEADARMIAEYAFRYQDKVKAYNPKSVGIQKLTALLKCHDRLKDIKVSLHNTLHGMSYAPEDALRPLRQALESIDAQLKEADKSIKKLLTEEEEFSQNTRLALTVPGISYITTAAILIDTRNFTRFTNPRQYASHVGCIPNKYDSGTTIHRKPHVSKASNRYVNSLLTEGSVSLMTHNAQTKEYVLKKKKEGKDNGCIINNTRNKIIHRLFAVIRRQEPFDWNYRNDIQKKVNRELVNTETPFYFC